MKVILLFDSDKLENVYREYTLHENIDKELREGKRVSIKFCHPFHGEVMIAQKETK